MRKIIVGAQVSLDGVMQSPGGSTEDPTKGFKFGGWAMPYGCQEFGEEFFHLFQNFDLLLGRKTYEIFAGYWPYYDEESSHGGIAKLFNGAKKYVVSRSGEVDTGWAGTELLRDVAAVKRLKQQDGPNLVTQGSTELVHALLKPPQDVKLKDPRDFKLVGKSTKRLDTPEKTNGKAVFGLDVSVPGMLVAAVARSPVFGGKVRSFNADKAILVNVDIRRNDYAALDMHR